MEDMKVLELMVKGSTEAIKEAVNQQKTMFFTIILVICVLIILVIVLLLVLDNMNREHKNAKSSYDTLNVDVIKLESTLKTFIDSYGLFESYMKTIENKTKEVNEMIISLQDTFVSIKNVGEGIKTQAGSIRHSVLEQTDAFEKKLTNFDRDFTATMKNNTDTIILKLQNTTEKSIKEVSLIGGTIDKSFDKNMTKLSNLSIRSIHDAAERSYGATVDAVSVAMEDSTIMFTKNNVSSTNLTLSEMRKFSLQCLETIKEACKENETISKVVDEQIEEVKSSPQKEISENSAVIKAKEELKTIFVKNGITSIVKENKIKRDLEAEMLASFQETNNFIEV